jgi:hypothetical protein
VIEKRAPTLEGREAILGQRERARSSVGPRIDQAHLDTIENGQQIWQTRWAIFKERDLSFDEAAR